MSKCIEISVSTNPLWAEYVTDILIEKIGCSGVVTEEQQVKDDVVIKSTIGVVKGYLPYTGDFCIEKTQKLFLDERKELVSSGIDGNNLGNWSVSTKEIKDEEWADSWKKFWHPQKIGSKVVICPSWEEYEAKSEEIILRLDPGSAFGTGSHPTTRLCIQALENIIPQFNGEISMADVGTGSGILAIAGVKLGISNIVGVDNDASVIKVAEENAEINAVGENSSFYAGSASDIDGKFDIVMANIIAQVLTEIMDDLEKLMKPESNLVLSGIIPQKLPEIEKSLEKNNLKVLEILREESWLAVISSKN